MLYDGKIKVKTILNAINIIILLYCSTGLDQLYLINLGMVTAGMRLIVYLAFIVSFIYFLKSVFNKNSKIIFKNKEILFFGFLVFTISLIASNFNLNSIVKSILLIGSIMYAIFLSNIYNEKNIFKIIEISQIIIIVVTIIFSMIIPEYGKMYYEGKQVWRGAFIHKNLLAANMAFNIIILLVTYKESKNKIFKIINILLSVIIIFLTGSMTSTIIVIISIIFLKIFSSIKVNPTYILILSNLIIFEITSKQERYGVIFQKIFNRDITFTGRSDIWIISKEVIEKKSFLGYGFGNIWGETSLIQSYMREKLGFNVTGTHNGFLEWLIQIGIVGTIFLVFIFVITGYRIIKIKKVNSQVFKFSIMYITYILMFYLTERVADPLSYQMLMLFLMISLVNKNYYKLNFKK